MPLIKDKTKRANEFNYYRPINIVPILSKIFETYISSYLSQFLEVHSNHLGFVRESGCNRASFALKTIIQYFLCNSSPVFLCSLDAEKAFDMVNHSGLLNLIIKREKPKIFILLLLQLVFFD